MMPLQLLQMILNKRSMNLNTNEHVGDYVLKVSGREDYLVGDYPILWFVYIQETLLRDITPTVVTVSVQSVPGEYNISMLNCVVWVLCFVCSFVNWFWNFY